MPLVYLLYRCPRCGHEPMGGEKDEARCGACRTRFSRGREGGHIRVEEASGAVWQVASERLSAAVEGWEERGRMDRESREAAGGSGGLIRRAAVNVRQSGLEEAVWYRGGLLGFAEALGPPEEGVLELTPDRLSLLLPDGGGGGERTARVWSLLDIRAVQTSSATVQISPRAGGVVQFRFRDDSPLRWENLLRKALAEAYRRERWGEIREFQPRVVTR